jgi:hypothetical protein
MREGEKMIREKQKRLDIDFTIKAIQNNMKVL